MMGPRCVLKSDLPVTKGFDLWRRQFHIMVLTTAVYSQYLTYY